MLPSSHEVPLGVAVLLQNPNGVPPPTQASAVQALSSLHGGGTDGVCVLNAPSPEMKLCGPMTIVLLHTAPVKLTFWPVVSLADGTSRCARSCVLSPMLTAPPTSMRMSAAVIGLIDWDDGPIDAPMPVVTPLATRITTGSDGSSRAP